MCMPRPIYLNRWQLWRSGACKFQRKLFGKTFGWSVEVNMENYKKALMAGLDVHFFIQWCRPLPKGMRAALRDLQMTRYDWQA